MKEKIHDLKTALNVLRIQQTVSFDDCQKLMTDVHDKTGFTPPNFEISGNQWCVLVNLAVARFGNTTPPQRKPLSDDEINKCDMCGYVGKDKDSIGQCPKCRWDELRPLVEKARQKPLTDDQIYDMYNEPRSDAEMLEFARAIEAAHGIKE